MKKASQKNPAAKAATPKHPGHLLRENYLRTSRETNKREARLSASEAARELGVSWQTLNSVLGEGQPVTPDLARRLDKLFGRGSNFWLQMQQAYDAWHGVVPAPRSKELRGYVKYINAKAASRHPDIGPALRAAYLANMREGLSEHLLDYAEGKVMAVDTEAARDLGVALRVLVGKHEHELFTLDADKNSGNSWLALNLIEDAVRYLEWARACYVKDRAPNKAVCDAFGVSGGTVRKWVRDHPQSIPDTAPPEEEVSFVSEMMLASGGRYRKTYPRPQKTHL